MGAFGRFVIVEPLDVVVDTCFPFFSVEELLHPCEDPLAALEAQLGKAAGGHESLFVAAIDVSPSLGRWFATGTDTGQPLASCKDEGGYDEPIGVQLIVGHQATASFTVASREIG